MDDSIEYNSSDLAYIVEQLGMRPLDPDIVGTELDGGGLAEASEEELQEYYFCRIDFDAHDHVFVERALADYRAACHSGEHGNMDAEPSWPSPSESVARRTRRRSSSSRSW